MNIKIISLSTIFLSSYLSAQVGVGTNDPKLTLDVVGKSSNATVADGIVAPRLTRTELIAKDAAYNTAQIGAIVYITGANYTDVITTKTQNVSIPGYYYFDGTQWEIIKADLRMVGYGNHITQDAGVNSNGSSVGTGSDNIGIGYSTLSSNTNGNNNIAIGSEALKSSTTSSDIIAIGSGALGNSTTGLRNLAIGGEALSSSTTSSDNTAVGFGSLGYYIETSNSGGNTALGNYSARGLTTGTQNTIIGNRALTTATIGNNNTVLGSDALGTTSTPSNGNTVVGRQAAQNMKGDNNVALGIGALGNSYASNTGNVAIGYYSGTGGASVTSLAANDLTFVGSLAQIDGSLTSGTLSFATAIGAGSRINTSNTVILGRIPGSPSINTIQDHIGIGTLAPSNALHVKATNPVKFEGLQVDATAPNVVVVDPATGVLKTITKAALVPAALVEPWNQQGLATATQANANTQNIYQQGNVAIGVTNADVTTAKVEKLYTKGDVKFENGSNAANDKMSNFSYNKMGTTSTVYGINSAGNDLESRSVMGHGFNSDGIPSHYLFSGTAKAGSEVFGEYKINTAPSYGEGYAIHSFITAKKIAGVDVNSYIGIDEQGLRIGFLRPSPPNPSISTDYATGISPAPQLNIDSYILPKTLPKTGEVLMFDSTSNSTSGYPEIAKTKWGNINTIADATNDAWINNATNTRVELGATSTGVARTAGTEIVATDEGKLGIGTSTPSSTLESKGSIEGNFREITTAYTLTDKDYHISFSGTANSTLTLPTQSLTDSSISDFRGRKYYIKNNTSSSDLAITAATGQNLRYGGNKSASNSYTLKPGNYALITASGAASGGWDLDLVSSVTKGNNWVLYDTDLNGIVNTQQTGFSATYATINNSSVTVTIPSGITSSRVVINYVGWGDALTSSTTATGSVRYQIVQLYNGTTTTNLNNIFMSSWSTNVAAPNGIRFNYPVSVSYSNLPAGTYNFTLQLKREDESGTISSFRHWGIQSKAEVYIKE